MREIQFIYGWSAHVSKPEACKRSVKYCGRSASALVPVSEAGRPLATTVPNPNLCHVVISGLCELTRGHLLRHQKYGLPVAFIHAPE
jgi:hypothetical protein